MPEQLSAKVNKPRGTRNLTFIVSPTEIDSRSGSNQHKRMRVILKRAGIPPWEDLFQALRRCAIQDLRHLLKDPWAVTTIAGHSEEVERKYYLSRLRDSDLGRITGLGGDAELELVTKSWSSLSRSEKDSVLNVIRSRGAEPQRFG